MIQSMMEHFRRKSSALDHRRLSKGGRFLGHDMTDQLQSHLVSMQNVHF